MAYSHILQYFVWQWSHGSFWDGPFSHFLAQHILPWSICNLYPKTICSLNEGICLCRGSHLIEPYPIYYVPRTIYHELVYITNHMLLFSFLLSNNRLWKIMLKMGKLTQIRKLSHGGDLALLFNSIKSLHTFLLESVQQYRKYDSFQIIISEISNFHIAQWPRKAIALSRVCQSIHWIFRY